MVRRRIACALLLHLLGCSAAEDLGVGLPQQWLRSSGPIARHRPGGSASFTVVDAHASEDTLFIQGVTTRFNTQQQYKKRSVADWFACDFASGAANATVAATKASLNPAHLADATTCALIECPLPAPCFDGTVTLRVSGPAAAVIPGIRVTPSAACGAPPTPSGSGDLAYCLAPVFGTNLNAALLIEWLEYHVALGFDRIHFYNMMGDRAAPDTRAVLARYVARGYVVNHDWSMAANPGPLWANPKAERQAVVMSAGAASFSYAQSVALYDCYLREHTSNPGASAASARAHGPSDWVWYGDVDEVAVVPLVEARKKQNLKALMAELPAKTKYIIHNSLITMFEKAQAPRMAPAPLLLSVVRAGDEGWPFLGDARIRVEHFFHNHYMNNPPRKAEMKKGAKIMRDIKFRDEAPDKILNGFAVDAAARGLAGLGPALTRATRSLLSGARVGLDKAESDETRRPAVSPTTHPTSMRRVSVGTLLGRREEDAWAREQPTERLALEPLGQLPRVSAGQPKAPVQRSVRLPGTPIDAGRAAPLRDRGDFPDAGGDVPDAGGDVPGRSPKAPPRVSTDFPAADGAPPAPTLLDCSPLPRLDGHDALDTALDEFEEILGHVRRGNDKLKKTAAKARRKSLNLESRTSDALPDAFGSRSAGSLGELPSVKKLRRERRKPAPVLSSLHELERERAAFEESTAELEKLVGAAQTVLLAS
ncbi:glycosyltransferase [Aureococcus anophagefferens]|nr:glycosyltransferase [Aureococcus anophagefferens]